MVGCITCAGLLSMYNVKNTTNCFRGQNPYEYCTHNTHNYYFFNSYIQVLCQYKQNDGTT